VIDMAQAKFDIAALDLAGLRTEAAKGLHAGVGAADLAIETVKEYVSEARELAQKRLEAAQKDAQKAFASAQKSVKDFEFEPKTLRTQATTVLNSRVEELSKDAKARRAAVEKRVADLQAEAQKFVTGNVETATGTYDKLAERGEKVVKRIRKESSSVVDPGPVTKTTGTTVTAKKAPAKKTTAKKAPAKKAPAKKAAAN
jgi:heparin binding hemagglutinin HbhA